MHFFCQVLPKKCIFEFVIHPWDAKIETNTLVKYNVDPVLWDPFKTSGDSKPTRWSPRTRSKICSAVHACHLNKTSNLFFNYFVHGT